MLNLSIDGDKAIRFRDRKSRISTGNQQFKKRKGKSLLP